MGTETGARSVEPRALVLSLVTHALVLASMVAAPAHAHPPPMPIESSFVDVALRDESARAPMPIVPDASAVPVADGELASAAPVIAHHHVRTARPRRRAEDHDTAIAPPIDLPTTPVPTDEPSSTPTLAAAIDTPSSIDDSASVAGEAADGAGVTGSGLGCADPWVGTWTWTSYSGAPANVRTMETFRITRFGAQLTVDLHAEWWVGYESDLVMPECGSRRQLAGHGGDVQSVYLWRAQTTEQDGIVRATSAYVGTEHCLGPRPVDMQLEVDLRAIPDRVDVFQWRRGRRTRVFTRTSCTAE